MEQNEKKKEFMRAFKFTVFSLSAGLIEMGSFSVIRLLVDWPYWPCYLIALVLSVLWNFTLNRQFTFQSANNIPIAMAKVAVFYVIFTPLSTIGGNYLVESLGWNDFVVMILTMLLNFVTEYLYDRFFVFGKTIDTNARALRSHN